VDEIGLQKTIEHVSIRQNLTTKGLTSNIKLNLRIWDIGYETKYSALKRYLARFYISKNITSKITKIEVFLLVI